MRYGFQILITRQYINVNIDWFYYSRRRTVVPPEICITQKEKV